MDEPAPRQVGEPSRSEFLGLVGSRGAVNVRAQPRRGATRGTARVRGESRPHPAAISPDGIRRNLEVLAASQRYGLDNRCGQRSYRDLPPAQRCWAPPLGPPSPPSRACARPISAEHALASAAVPFLFPAVRIDKTFYCDGGLRQNVPLSPASRSGRTASSSSILATFRRTPGGRGREREVRDYPGPFFLFGQGVECAAARSHRRRHRQVASHQPDPRGG